MTRKVLLFINDVVVGVVATIAVLSTLARLMPDHIGTAGLLTIAFFAMFIVSTEARR